MRLTFTLLALLVVMVGSSRVNAGPSADALAREGVQLRRIGKDAEALSKFKAAFEASSDPKHQAQLGLCLQALGRWVEAEDALSESLQSPSHAWIQQNRDVLKESLEAVKTRIGSLDIVGSPAEAHVSIDGREVGTLPLPQALRLNQGPVVLELSAPGYAADRRELMIAGGEYRKLQVDLRPESTPSTVPTLSPSEREPIAISDASRESAASKDSAGRTWLWVGAGAALVAIGVTVLLLSGGETNPEFDGQGNL